MAAPVAVPAAAVPVFVVHGSATLQRVGSSCCCSPGRKCSSNPGFLMVLLVYGTLAIIFSILIISFLRKRKKPFVCLTVGEFFRVFSFPLPSSCTTLQSGSDSPAGFSRLGESPFQKIREVLLYIHSKNKTAPYFWSVFQLLISKILEILN